MLKGCERKNGADFGAEIQFQTKIVILLKIKKKKLGK